MKNYLGITEYMRLTNEEQREYEAIYLDYETRIILYGFQLKRK